MDDHYYKQIKSLEKDNVILSQPYDQSHMEYNHNSFLTTKIQNKKFHQQRKLSPKNKQ